MFSWPVILNATALSFSGFKKAGLGFRCHAAHTYSLIFAAEQNTDHRRKKCPPQEISLFAYFFGVEKSKASDGTRPVGLAFDFRQKHRMHKKRGHETFAAPLLLN
jgi:hypothetical protein